MLVLISILAVYIVPKIDFQGYEGIRAKVELVQGIRYAQFQSLYRSATPGFGIVITTSDFTVVDPGGNALPDPAATGDYNRTFDAGTFSNAVTITFDGRGQPTCSNDCSAVDLVLTAAGETITMEHFTGFVH